MGVAGIPWFTTDIGGFTGGWVDDPAFRELLVRWFQFGAFSPVMRLHGDRRPQQPVATAAGEYRLESGADNEVWSYGPEIEETFVSYIRLREALRPYTRALMAEAHEHGTPVMRGLFYEFPDDACCWQVGDQFLFGADVLVARPGARRHRARCLPPRRCDLDRRAHRRGVRRRPDRPRRGPARIHPRVRADPGGPGPPR